MAQTVVDIVVKTVGLGKLRQLDQQLKGIQPSAVKAGRAVDGVSKAVSGLGRAIAAAAIGDQLRRAFGAAAGFSATQQRVQNLTTTYQQFIGIQDLAAQSARRFGISNAQALSDLTDLGARLGGTGATLRDLENIYQGFNTLLVNNAIGAQQAAAATLQLNQALGSGRLAGEEFNAINEATPQLLDEVAKVMGVARGELKKLASDGEISSKILLKALQNIKTKGADALAASLDTPAGKLRQFDAAIKDFQIAVGTELLPVITPLVQELTKILQAFGQLPEPIRTAGVAAAAAAVGFGALNLALGTLGVNVVALTGGALARLAGLLAVVGGGAKTTAVGFTAAGAAITKTTIAVNAATVALGALKVAIIALPLAALAAVLNENIQRKREFDEVMRSNAPDVLTGKITELTQKKEQLKSTLNSIKGGRWYKGMESDINQIQGQINELDRQIDVATRRRQLIVDIQVQGAIPNFDTLSDAGIQEALRLAGVGTTPTPVISGGGGGGGGGGGAAPRESQVPQLTRELELSNKLLENDRQRLEAQFNNNTAQLNKLAQDRIAIELAGQKAEIAAEDIPVAEKKLKLALAENQATLQTLELKNQIAEAERQRVEALSGVTQPLEEEIELLQAKLNGNEEEIKQLQEIRRLKQSMLDIDPNADTSGVEGLVRQRDELKAQAEEADKLKQMYSSLASGIAGEFTSAFKSIIDGSKDVNEAFADMLQGIADQFLNMAMKILQDALTQQLMGLFTGLMGGGVGGGVGGGFGATPLTSGMQFFEGGGYTGDAPRSGGLDGKGGFLSVLHPQETVTDHYGDAAAAMAGASGAFAESSEAMQMATATRSANTAAAAEASAMQTAETYFANGKSTISFDTYRVGEMDVVTREDAMKIGMESAKKAEANVYKGLRNMPAVRGRTGVK